MKFFVTHSWKDIEFARRLADDLRAHGLEGFFDMYSIKPGQNIAERIARGLEECDVYVPILSAAALQSTWCKEEINAAITMSNEPGRNGRPLIIPILVENCQNEMPIFLRSRLYINFTERYEEALQELLAQGFGVTTAQRVEPTRTVEPPPPQLKSAVLEPQMGDAAPPKGVAHPVGGFAALFESLKTRASLPEVFLWTATGALVGCLVYAEIEFFSYSFIALLPGIILSALAFLAVFFVWEVIQYQVARAIGGNGNLIAQMNLQSIPIALFMIVARVRGLALSSELATPATVLFFLIGLFLLYLLILTVRISHGLTTMKAALTSIVPWLFGLIAYSLLSDWFFFLPSS